MRRFSGGTMRTHLRRAVGELIFQNIMGKNTEKKIIQRVLGCLMIHMPEIHQKFDDYLSYILIY